MVKLFCEVPDEGELEYDPVDDSFCDKMPVELPVDEGKGEEDQNNKQPVHLQELHGPDHDLSRKREHSLQIGEDLHELGHNKDKEYHNKAKHCGKDYGWVCQGRLYIFFQLDLPFHIDHQIVQYLFKTAGSLTCPHHACVIPGKDVRIIKHGVRY